MFCLLTLLGTDVTLAKDGVEALEKIQDIMSRNESFGVVLMDVQMPNMDGLQCTRTVRSLGYVGPIIALTAFADEGNKNECLEAGMNYFLPKPIDKSHLKQVLKICTGLGSITPSTPELNSFFLQHGAGFNEEQAEGPRK